MKRLIVAWLYSLVLATGNACAEPTAYFAIYSTMEHGYAYGFAANIDRTGGSPRPLRDFTVAAQFSARNGPGATVGLRRGYRGVGAAGFALDPRRAGDRCHQRGGIQRLPQDR